MEENKEEEVHIRKLYAQLLNHLGVEGEEYPQREALRVIATLKEKAGVLGVVMRHLDVKHHWQVTGNLKGDGNDGTK